MSGMDPKGLVAMGVSPKSCNAIDSTTWRHPLNDIHPTHDSPYLRILAFSFELCLEFSCLYNTLKNKTGVQEGNYASHSEASIPY
jgi:hypothetical protein